MRTRGVRRRPRGAADRVVHHAGRAAVRAQPRQRPGPGRRRASGPRHRAGDVAAVALRPGTARPVRASRGRGHAPMCAGNRRARSWTPSPRSPARSSGAAMRSGTGAGAASALADVLLAAGLKPEATHVWFRGADLDTHHGDPFPYAASIPLERALSTDDVLLAYELNGEPLTPLHGGPVARRGSRRDRRAEHQVAGRDHGGGTAIAELLPGRTPTRLFGLEVTAETVDWDATDGIHDQQLGSFIGNPPRAGSRCRPAFYDGGYATAGGGSVGRRGRDPGGRGAGAGRPGDAPRSRPGPGAWMRWRAEVRAGARYAHLVGGTGHRFGPETASPRTCAPVGTLRAT